MPFTVTTYSAVCNKMGVDSLPAKKVKLFNLKDKVQRFDEAAVCEGALGRFPASEVIGVVKNFRDAVRNLL